MGMSMTAANVTLCPRVHNGKLRGRERVDRGRGGEGRGGGLCLLSLSPTFISPACLPPLFPLSPSKFRLTRARLAAWTPPIALPHGSVHNSSKLRNQGCVKSLRAPLASPHNCSDNLFMCSSPRRRCHRRPNLVVFTSVSARQWITIGVLLSFRP